MQKEQKISKEDARKLYFKNWRKNNPDKVKKHNATFWEKKAKELKEKSENN